MTGRTDPAALEELLWASDTLLAARVSDDGVVLAANDALQRFAGGDATGAPAAELVSAPQRQRLAQALRDAGDAWDAIPLGMVDGNGVEDRRVLLRRMDEGVLLVAEPAERERDQLVDQVLALNEDLIAAQRSLSKRQRELERAQADATASADRVRRLESIMLVGLTRPTLADALRALLDTARDVIAADRAAIFLRDDSRRHLVLAASTPGIPDERIAIGRGLAGTIAATGQPRLEEDGRFAGVPLVLEKETIGVLYLVADRPGQLGGGDLSLLERVGERAALSVGHAQLRERERAVVEALQRSLLPDALPEVEGVGLCGRYLPRTAGVEVGGDFYDAVRLDDGRVSLSIGDVAGKGLEAAAQMGRLRSALDVVARETGDPGVVLERIDRLVVEAVESMATALQVVLDPVTGDLTYANAGHPPALRIGRDGSAEWLTGALAPPLGTGWPIRGTATATLAAGDRLMLYTDGLVERRRATLDDGLAALAEAATANRPRFQDLCEGLVDELSAAAGGFEDDVAVLVVEFNPNV